MIGKACYNTGDYKTAMKYFEECGNREMYSDAREAIRMGYIYEYSWIGVIVIVVIIALYVIRKLKNIKNTHKYR